MKRTARQTTNLRITPDEINSAKHDVTWGDDHLGVIFDETPAALSRGGWAAWSPKAESRDGIVGFFPTKEAAAAAIAKTHGIDAVLEEQEERCTPMAGGKVHTMARYLVDEEAWPLCRSGGMDSRGTRYRSTTEPLSCTACLDNAQRRARRAAG
ncbi:hypothetical protein [Streptomyces sp. NPDC051173]|uniref:hypothetical protein n=1 Tax=Streptomyces sp. NPDC051173 TaxID=3155164 RepID=UPI00344C7044